eukprot:TRINITY_DN1646_c0_g2_i1.p2 TRINITY_DN1646_c0_g2~~TRINITY_DN1646_c0_g2_i1.p2  ORF type:complete len:114 (+),score=20.19 TRINITY_DN1646_c0_g2_i1:89-430(+)
MSGERKEKMELDDTKSGRALFVEIKSQGSSELQTMMKETEGTMLLLYNGQQVATSNQQEQKHLNEFTCWPTSPDAVPILQLYLPKHHKEADKPAAGTSGAPAIARRKECCMIM